ncbi:hypothetical protein Tco_1347682 [Tanacetum coccineum]
MIEKHLGGEIRDSIVYKQTLKIDNVSLRVMITVLQIRGNVDIKKSIDLINSFHNNSGQLIRYTKNRKKTVKSGQARTRESEEYKRVIKSPESKARKVQPQSNPVNNGQQKSTTTRQNLTIIQF